MLWIFSFLYLCVFELWHNSFILACFTAVTFWSWIVLGIIITYISNKEPDNITLLDKFKISLSKIYAVLHAMLNIQMYFSIFPLPLNKILALLFYITNKFLVSKCLLWILLTALVRYFNIFHPSYFADLRFTDQEIWTQAHFIVSMITLIIFIFDNLFLVDLEYEFTYQRLIGNMEHIERKNVSLHLLLLVIVIFSLIFIQYKIKRSGFVEENFSNFFMRGIFFLIFLVGLTILIEALYGITSFFGIQKNPFVGLFFSSFLACVPSLFVMGSGPLRNYVLNKTIL